MRFLAWTLLLIAPSALAQDTKLPTESGGEADIATQGYYLGGGSQPLSALTGMSIAFREYLPALGYFTGTIEGYADSTRGRTGFNSVTLHDLFWKSRRWTITGGDSAFHTALIPTPFTNYSWPDIAIRGARLDMNDGTRQFSFFAGEETLQEGPRITFRITAPQTVIGASVLERIGSRLTIAARYLDLSSSQTDIAANPVFFPEGSEFRRADSLTIQTSWSASHGITLFADNTLSHAVFSTTALFPQSVPYSAIYGAKWKAKRLSVIANYGRLSRSALPVVGTYFGDRAGPYAELRYNAFGTLELFASALRAHNNLEANPNLPTITTEDLTAGANLTLPGAIGLSAQYSKLALWQPDPQDGSQEASQHDTSAQVSLTKTLKKHALQFTARNLALDIANSRQQQKSAELQDSVTFSALTIGGAMRFQQQSSDGQLQNSLYARASGQLRVKRLSLYGQFEAGNDLVNKTLFATNNAKTTVIGVELPLLQRLKSQGWTLRAEAFRTTLLTTLNPASILVLQGSETPGVTDILNDFNQWSFYVRLSHRAQWGVPPPEAAAFTGNAPVYGTIEGFVYDDATGTHPAPDVAVQLDKSRTVTTDASGHYRFDDVPEGAHTVLPDLAELAADYSPGPPPTAPKVKPRAIARVDLRLVKAGTFIRGTLRGLAPGDEGTVRLENIVINLISPAGDQLRYTTCDSDGDFAFYNLPAGKYHVAVDPATLPENYILISPPSIDADTPHPEFIIRKQVKQLPIRRVL